MVVPFIDTEKSRARIGFLGWGVVGDCVGEGTKKLKARQLQILCLIAFLCKRNASRRHTEHEWSVFPAWGCWQQSLLWRSNLASVKGLINNQLYKQGPGLTSKLPFSVSHMFNTHLSRLAPATTITLRPVESRPYRRESPKLLRLLSVWISRVLVRCSGFFVFFF